MGTIQQPPTPAEARKHLLDMLREFDTAMVVTRADDGTMHARPMAIARLDDGGAFYFATRVTSPKVAEIERDHDVLVTVQGKRTYASVSGVCRFSQDRALIDQLWSETWRAWFDDKNDPTIVVLVVEARNGEYWDNTGLRGVTFLFDAIKGILGGEKAANAPGDQNAKVDLRGRT